MTGHDERRLGELLHTAATPTPRVDLATAIRDGRRRRIRQRAVTVAAVLALLGAVAAVAVRLAPGGTTSAPEPFATDPPVPSSAAPRECRPVPVGGDLGPDAWGYVVAVSRSGRYVVVTSGTRSSSTMALYRDGVRTSFPGGRGSVSAVSDNGVLIGVDNNLVPWMYADGRFTDLRVPSGYKGAKPEAVNADGRIVGWAARSAPAYLRDAAVVWEAGRPDEARILNAQSNLQDKSSSYYAAGVDVDGTVLSRAGADHLLWPPDGGPPLTVPMPPGTENGSVSRISNGWLAGSAAAHGEGRLVRWAPGRDRSPVLLPIGGQPVGLADDGTLVLADPMSIVAPDGSVRPVGAKEAGLLGSGITADGRTVVGTSGTSGPGVGPNDQRPVRFEC